MNLKCFLNTYIVLCLTPLYLATERIERVEFSAIQYAIHEK